MRRLPWGHPKRVGARRKRRNYLAALKQMTPAEKRSWYNYKRERWRSGYIYRLTGRPTPEATLKDWRKMMARVSKRKGAK